jgi:hypothetical protein
MLFILGNVFFPFLPSWATKEVWSPSNDVGVLGGNRNSSIVIRQWGYVELQPKFFLSPCDTPPLFHGDQKQIRSPKKAWGEGHEMIIITKGG